MSKKDISKNLLEKLTIVPPCQQPLEEEVLPTPADPGCNPLHFPKPSPSFPKRRTRLSRSLSTSEKEPVLRTRENRTIYTAGRPPWYDKSGQMTEPLVIGICGGSASGKTTVANKIISELGVPWVTHLSMDSFYKVLNEEQHRLAAINEYDFDHPNAFDFPLLAGTIEKLKEMKKVEVPVYNFVSHQREKKTVSMYGANVIVFEGIMAFHDEKVRDLINIKIFVDHDSDIRLARRLKRDITERGRDIHGVMEQYEKYVKPSFNNYIGPCVKYADLIVPRGGENPVALDLIVQHVQSQLAKQSQSLQSSFSTGDFNQWSGQPLPSTLKVLPPTPQVRGLQTIVRNRDTSREEFIFYSKRLIRLVMEYSLSLLPFHSVRVLSSQEEEYEGKRCAITRLCGVSIIRAGETMELALSDVCKDIEIGKIVIQINPGTSHPELYYLRLPQNIKDYRVFLMDAIVANGATAMMAVRVLLDHEVPEQNISLVSLLMAESGVQTLTYAFPQLTIVTTAVDPSVSPERNVLPGMGNFADRYFGTEPTQV